MIHIKTHGIKSTITFCFFVVVLSVMGSSCSTYKVHDNYYLNGATYYNDSLPLYVTFFGDIVFESPKEIDNQKIRQRVRGIRGIASKNLLLSGKTNAPPNYEVLLFAKEHLHQTLKQDTIIINEDPQKKHILFKRFHDKKEISLLLCPLYVDKNYRSIRSDGQTILNSIRFTKADKELTYFDVFNTYKSNSNHLFTIDKLKKAPVHQKNEWLLFQLITTLNSFTQNNTTHDSLINTFEASRKKEIQPLIDTLIKTSKPYQGQSAIEEIKKAAKQTKIVMLNENHWYPKHRKLATKLLQPLQEVGYNYLAIEAVNKDQDSILNARGYPVKSTGYYTREPHFGALIRKAKQLGYTIIGYDEIETDHRDKTQAMNISTVISSKSDAKIFIYAGLDHVLEEKSLDKMAYHVKELTKIDPLTINQSELVASTKEELSLFPSNLFTSHKKIKSSTDFLVLNNFSVTLEDTFQNLQNKEILVNDTRTNQNVQVSIYTLHEYEKHKSNSIPILNLIKKTYKGKLNIKLPTGMFWMKIMDIEDKVLHSDKIIINID